jgi:uncharacterized UBP type Zn finger protein
MDSPAVSFLNPERVLDAMPVWGAKLGTQQDAEEFLTCLLTEINASREHVAFDCFGATFNTKRICVNPSCDHAELSSESSLVLSVGRARAVQDAVEAFFEPQRVQLDREICSCGESHVLRSTTLVRAPRTLIVQLKRFTSRGKQSFTCHPSKLIQVNDSMYVLRALIPHSGTAKNGHYTAKILLGTKAFLLDDICVSETSADFSSQASVNTAYLFAYDRLDTLHDEVKRRPTLANPRHVHFPTPTPPPPLPFPPPYSRSRENSLLASTITRKDILTHHVVFSTLIHLSESSFS